MGAAADATIAILNVNQAKNIVREVVRESVVLLQGTWETGSAGQLKVPPNPKKMALDLGSRQLSPHLVKSTALGTSGNIVLDLHKARCLVSVVAPATCGWKDNPVQMSRAFGPLDTFSPQRGFTYHS